jgi:hypothetical protein
MINLLRAAYTSLRARSFLAYLKGMSRYSLRGALSLQPLATITQGFRK